MQRSMNRKVYISPIPSPIMEKVNFAIYARESTSDTNKAPPIKKQIEIGKRWGREKGYNLVLVFSDNGYSGGDWNRPDWNRAVREARGNHFKILWTWDQDRLARDTEQFLWFYRHLSQQNVKVFSETEGEINMDTTGERLKHTSLAMAAETFRLITADKVKKAYESKKKIAEEKNERVKWGRKPGKYNVGKMIELRKQGYGYKAIARMVGDCSYQTVRRILQNTPLNSTSEKEDNTGTTE